MSVIVFLLSSLLFFRWLLLFVGTLGLSKDVFVEISNFVLLHINFVREILLHIGGVPKVYSNAKYGSL